MSRIRSRRPSLGLLALLSLAVPSLAHASSGLDSPDAGVVQVGRGGAWVARAEDPLAAYMNPAAMSFQASGIHLGAHLMVGGACFTRIDEGAEPISPGNNIPGPGDPNGPEAETCTTSVFPNPQLAGVIRITPELALGLAVVAPHAVGNVEWPESVEFELAGNLRTQPAPNRYLLTQQQSILLFPTASISYAVIPDELSIGAGFTWGIAHADFTTFTESTSSAPEDDFTRDVKANLVADDFFIPGFVVGVNWRASKRFDFGAWYKFSDAIRARTKLTLESNYWLAGGTQNENPCTPADPDCNKTVDDDAGSLEFNIPMEAKIGGRYHHPLPGDAAGSPFDGRRYPEWAKREGYVRDPLSEDRFDVEADFTWANNSAVDVIAIQFDPGIKVKGTPGEVPVNGDIAHRWKDVLGVRVGGEVTILPNFLAARLGGFFEGKGQRDEDLTLDFHMGYKAGLSLGGTVRLGPVDMHLAYGHVFYGTLDNLGQGTQRALSGDATTNYRSQQIVNGGSFSSSLDEVALGATLRF